MRDIWANVYTFKFGLSYRPRRRVTIAFGQRGGPVLNNNVHCRIIQLQLWTIAMARQCINWKMFVYKHIFPAGRNIACTLAPIYTNAMCVYGIYGNWHHTLRDVCTDLYVAQVYNDCQQEANECTRASRRARFRSDNAAMILSIYARNVTYICCVIGFSKCECRVVVNLLLLWKKNFAQLVSQLQNISKLPNL